MKFVAEVYEPMYDFNEKKYIRVKVPDRIRSIIENMHAKRRHTLKSTHVDDPLEGSVLKVKVPFRYRRVMCVVEGRPLQTLIRGDEIVIVVDFKGVWHAENHCGFSWVLSSSTFSSSSSEA